MSLLCVLYGFSSSSLLTTSSLSCRLDLIRWRLHSDPYLEHLGLGCRALHGGMNVKARDACLKEFREDNNVRVLLMSLKAGGVALNLTCANHIYLSELLLLQRRRTHRHTLVLT